MAMACFVRVQFFAVLIFIVVANSTILDNNTITTTFKSIPLENFAKESARVRPVRPGNQQESVRDLENQIPVNKFNRGVKTVAEFWEKRNALANLEVYKLLGNKMPLNNKELEANQIILFIKFAEFDKSLNTNQTFPPSQTFYKVKALIDEAEIFEIIRKVPKGGTLTSILVAAVSFSFMYELTFEDNLYYLFEENTLQFRFARITPEPGWRLISEIRDTDDKEFLDNFNQKIKNRLTIIPNPEGTESAPTFREVLRVYSNLTSYRPNLEKSFNQALEVLYEDNVMYADFYYHFPEVYDLSGKIYTPLEVLKLFKTLLGAFILTHKDFMGVRFIYSPIDSLSKENFIVFRRTSTLLWRANPELFVGFGVAIVEENEEPYSYWIEELLKFPKEMKLFLDAGVTNNWGINADYNLLDAVVLNSAALGAGIALNKHPLIIEKLRQKGVTVKSCPTATQALGLVNDIRTHPLTLLVATDFPITICNVGGTAWNATGLSYDWYEAYMAMTPRFCDLRCLKQLAVNSLLHSNLSNEEKKKSIKLWQKKWDEFIDFVIDNYNIKVRNDLG